MIKTTKIPQVSTIRFLRHASEILKTLCLFMLKISVSMVIRFN